MVLTAKPLLILKIISAVCLLYLAQYYLLFALFFQAEVGALFEPIIALVLIAVLAGATLVSCSLRQFFKPLKRLLPLAFVFTVLAHISIFFTITWLEQSYVSFDFNDLLERSNPEIQGFMNDAQLLVIKAGVLHLFAFIIPFIVNFRKQPPIDPVFE